MILDSNLQNQLSQYLELLENPINLVMSLDDSDKSKKLKEFINEISQLSDKISVEESKLDLTPSFAVNKENEETGIVFAGIPLGHEFESLVLALLQVGGRQPKISDEQIERIKSIDEKLNFETVVSLTCHNCPDVVQALNIMSVLNDNISHTMIEGGTFEELVEKRGVMAVPTVFLNNEELMGGKASLDNILDKVTKPAEKKELKNADDYDVLIVGGGPAAGASAIYAARKGYKTAIICDEFGGQVVETLSIENIIGIKYTEGPKYMDQIRDHLNEYDIKIFEGYKVDDFEKDDQFVVKVGEDSIKSKSLIFATGARWKSLKVPGEKEFLNKGIAYCVHCDGPLFKDKNVAVIGGGNSGVEAAIDLSPIAKKVTLIEYSDSLKADQVLQEKLSTLDNIEIIKNAQTTEINGDTKVNGLTYIDRNSNEENHIDIEGCFIQIGLVPNTEFLEDKLEKNKFGEIVVDEEGQTNIEGVFAAGDCTTVKFKQIVTALGSGATAALGANNYLIRNSVK